MVKPDKVESPWKMYTWRPGIAFPLIIFLLGMYWLLSDLNVIPHLPIWPLLLTAFGLWLILKHFL
ncbi:MAG: hypothetical protein V1735_06250 [Nanoarchaeota archaeon]